MTSAASGAGGDTGREAPTAGLSNDGGASRARDVIYIKLGTFGEALADLLVSEYGPDVDAGQSYPVGTARDWLAGCLFASNGLPADDAGSLAVARFFSALLDLVEDLADATGSR